MRVFAFVVGFVLNFMLYGAGHEIGGLDWWQIFALLAVLNFLAILLHEIGHAWAFLHVGGSVQRIAVGFLLYDVPRHRLRFSKRLIGGDIGGYVAGRYGPHGPTVRSAIIVAAAGPVANVISGAAALAFAALVGRPRLEDFLSKSDGSVNGSGPAKLPDQATVDATLASFDVALQQLMLLNLGFTALVQFGVLSLGLALINLLPFDGSDGQAIVRALKQLRMLRGKSTPR